MARPVVDLPQPDSPTRPSVSPLLDVEGDAVDGLVLGDLALDQEAGRDGEVDLEVFDVDQDLSVAG